MATYITETGGKSAETEYGGAHLRVEVDGDGEARLLVNGLVRDKSGPAPNLLLTSTVQTDYEWHEFVEARVLQDDNTVEIVIACNKQEVAHDRHERMPA